MKRILKILLLVFICAICFNVHAEIYKVKDLIPVDTSATVETELFKYDGMIYNSSLDAKGYAHLTFSGITSKAKSKIPISINVLLYDENKINIGYLTYCTDKDFSSDNNRRKIAPNETIGFDIAIVKKYLPTEMDKDNGPSKVKYIAVMDENEYCTIGGYDKYLGLKHEEIVGGLVKDNTTEDGIMKELIVFLRQDGIKVIALTVIISLLLLLIQGIILNMLHCKMFIDSTLLAYLPIGCHYVSVKCAFGPKVAKIYVILLLLSIPLSFMTIGLFFFGLLSIISFISFILVLIKLITRKYDLCYFDPEFRNNKSMNVELSEPSVVNSVSTKKAETLDDTEEGSNVEGNQVVDLNFGDQGFSYNDSLPDPSVLNDDSFEAPVSGGAATKNNDVASDENKKDEVSDLTKFFS